MKKINMKKTVSTVLIAAMLASGAGNAFAISKEECESASNCIVYDGGSIDFDYKEIFVPNDKRAEFNEQQALLEKSAHNLNLIKTGFISAAVALPAIIVSILPILKHYKDYKKMQNDLGVSLLKREIKNAKLELIKNQSSNENLYETQNKIDNLEKEIDKINTNFKGSDKDKKLSIKFIFAYYEALFLAFLSCLGMKLVIPKIVESRYRSYGDGWKFDKDGNLRTNFVYENNNLN